VLGANVLLCLGVICRHNAAAGALCVRMLERGGGLEVCAQLQLLQEAAGVNPTLKSPVAAAVGSCCSSILFTHTHVGCCDCGWLWTAVGGWDLVGQQDQQHSQHSVS
jgi:hypothetical protein